MPKDQNNRMRPSFDPPKPMKTERTHEENQERAYVAASRRSDRSLEARVESARRASEIHKRRTGRAFKITIEGVEKEEMYEEEDDLPSQYRNLSNHLYSSGGGTFNDRMQSFLASNVEMRRMLAVQMQQFEAQQRGQVNPNQFNNNMAMQPMQMGQPMQMQMPMSQPQPQYNPSPTTTNNLRHTPYPSPRPPQQAFPQGHQRSASFAVPGQPTPIRHSPVVPAIDHRRMSMPAAVPSAADSPLATHSPHSAPSVPHSPRRPESLSRQASSQGFQQPQQQPISANDMASFQSNYFPFSAQLPANAQGLLGSTLDPNDPMTSVLMAGSQNMPTSYYDFGAQPQATGINSSGQQTHPTLDGLGSTLAPSAFDMSAGIDQSQSNFFNDAFSSGAQVTPGVEWNSFLNNDDWDELKSSQQSTT